MRSTCLGVLVGLIGALALTAQEATPGPRFGHELVFDEARGVVLLFGGFGPDGVPKGDTWTWDGTRWRLASPTGPSPRKWPAATYDARRRTVVLHGGREGVERTGPSLDDTWTWDGTAWSEVETPGPGARDHHRIAYDRRRDRVVLFGGWNGQGLEQDTWEWDGTTWARIAVQGPSARAPLGLAFDEARGTVVLAGGQNLDGAYSDAWEFDGSAWTKLAADMPAPRGFHAMTYSPLSGSVLVFGGRSGDELYDDLWSLRDLEWTRLSQDGPLRRGIYASAFDRERGVMVIHGSGDFVAGQWDLDGRTWAWAPESGWRVIAGEH